jgi:hypothetical protein
MKSKLIILLTLLIISATSAFGQDIIDIDINNPGSSSDYTFSSNLVTLTKENAIY